MAGLWVIGEVTADGGLARISTEVATLARTLAEAAGQDVAGIVVARRPEGRRRGARDLPAAGPRAHGAGRRGQRLGDDRGRSDRGCSRAGHEGIHLRRSRAGRSGRRRGALGAHRLGNPREHHGRRLGRRRSDDRHERLRREADDDLRVHRRDRDRRRSGRTSSPPSRPRSAGSVEAVKPVGDLAQPLVTVVERVAEATAAAPIEEARIIVAGGRGVGGPEGFKLVEEIAEALGGAVGATRAAVDAGWIPYAQQIGQTGKIVKPQLYLALGISGAIQHKVGMQTAETIVAVNRDPDAPIAEFADLVVVGDLFEVGPALLTELRARSG